jgi:hypothetical protein
MPSGNPVPTAFAARRPFPMLTPASGVAQRRLKLHGHPALGLTRIKGMPKLPVFCYADFAGNEKKTGAFNFGRMIPDA